MIIAPSPHPAAKQRRVCDGAYVWTYGTCIVVKTALPNAENTTLGQCVYARGQGHALDTKELLRKAASIHKKSYSCHRECEQETWQLAIAIEQSMGLCDQSQIVDLAFALNDVLEIRDQNQLSRLKP